MDEWNTDMIQRLFMLQTAKLIATAAQLRTESRGAHNRQDFPEEDWRWGQLHIVQSKKGIEMREDNMNTIKLRSMLEQFYLEDIGDGDLSSELLFPETVVGELTILAKMDGVFCGKKVIEEGMHVVDRQTVVNCHVEDG